MGLSAPSGGKATGASPLSLAALGFAVGSAPPPVAKPPEPPPSASLPPGLPSAQHRNSSDHYPLRAQRRVEPIRSASLRSVVAVFPHPAMEKRFLHSICTMLDIDYGAGCVCAYGVAFSLPFPRARSKESLTLPISKTLK